MAAASGARATVGLAEASYEVTKDELLREADLALIEAKRQRQPMRRYSKSLTSQVGNAEGEGSRGHALSLSPPSGN
jgi:hypothetical protein